MRDKHTRFFAVMGPSAQGIAPGDLDSALEGVRNVIETHEHAGEFKEPSDSFFSSQATILGS